jgi:hypothetical protein
MARYVTPIPSASINDTDLGDLMITADDYPGQFYAYVVSE